MKEGEPLVTVVKAPMFVRPGVHEVASGLTCDVLEPKGVKPHKHIRASLPAAYPIEKEFETGPVVLFRADRGITDGWLGITMDERGRVIRESTVVQRLAESYSGDLRRQAWKQAKPDSATVLTLATQRTANYCRWWLDSVAKLYLAQRSRIADVPAGAQPVKIVYRQPSSSYERATLELLKRRFNFQWEEAAEGSPMIQARALNSPGVTFGGGQRIGALVTGYADWLAQLVPDAETPSYPLVYISRNESSMRRVMNEDALLPGLEALGFHIVRPSTLKLEEQILLFRNAKVVAAPHGAGLTNLLFCRPGTKVVEIFPEGGVHGSAFLRISSHREFPYYFIVGRCIVNDKTKKNPNNTDLELDVPATLAFLRDVVNA